MSAATDVDLRTTPGAEDVEVLCSRRNWAGTPRCDEPATVRLVGMCVHEHLTRETAYCDHHAEVDAKAERLTCTPCHDGPEPHFCPVRVIDEVPL